MESRRPSDANHPKSSTMSQWFQQSPPPSTQSQSQGSLFFLSPNGSSINHSPTITVVPGVPVVQVLDHCNSWDVCDYITSSPNNLKDPTVQKHQKSKLPKGSNSPISLCSPKVFPCFPNSQNRPRSLNGSRSLTKVPVSLYSENSKGSSPPNSHHSPKVPMDQ